jgi:hypothetical protein
MTMLIGVTTAEWIPIDSPTNNEILQFAKGFIAGDSNIDSAQVEIDNDRMYANYTMRPSDPCDYDSIRSKIDKLLKALGKTADKYPHRIRSIFVVVQEQNGTLKGVGVMGTKITDFSVAVNKPAPTSDKETLPN